MAAFPNPSDLKYFDHTDSPPTDINMNTPFNDEMASVWLGYDDVGGNICITNSSRSLVICCFAIAPNAIDPITLKYFDSSDNTPTDIDSSTPFNDPESDVWIGWDIANCLLCITNFSRTIVIGCVGGTFSEEWEQRVGGGGGRN